MRRAKWAEPHARGRGEVFASMAARMRLVVIAALASGCSSYAPGSFAYPSKLFPGQRATVGCLDISVDRRPDYDGKAVLDYQFGNRCDEPVTIDLAHVPVTGRTADGSEVRLEAYDPNLEMIAMKIDARKAGGEAIAYAVAQPLVQVCADAAAIGESKENRWMCFASAVAP